MELPLFPLNTVLFPGASVPLHIFEDRYKQMIGRCLAQKSPFGICLIKSGEEMGGPADTFPVGTTAQITAAQELEDGRLNIICLGGQRFRLLTQLAREPYLLAEVEILQTHVETDPVTLELAHTAGLLFADYLRLYLAISNQWARAVEMPSEPDRLADHIASRIAVDHRTKQGLLEELSAHNRLATEIDLLGTAIEEMTPRVDFARASRWHGFAVMN